MAKQYRFMEGLLVRHVVTVDGASKERLFTALARSAAAELDAVDADEVRQRLREREEMLSTRLGSAIAISLLYALTEQRIRQNDVIVNVYGSYDPGVIDTIQVTDVEAALRRFFSVSRELSRIDSAFIIDDDGGNRVRRHLPARGRRHSRSPLGIGRAAYGRRVVVL